ncbi:MAG: NAD-dependent epimerase/dehydratase family protein [Gemmatimonadales bacterium]|nr:NAD-dependent epimerase/dehydratase family protein [Gemmatimonadales bacterium]
MPASRRDFLRTATVIGTGLALGSTEGRTQTEPARPERPSTDRTGAPKKLLMLGGTGFIGPHMVRYAVERGHEVTILTRGRSQAKVAGVEHLIADREGDLSVLSKRKWDAVLDNNARDYRWVARSVKALKDSTDHYLFVSSISAYRTATMSYATAGTVLTKPAVDETSERFAPPPNWKDGEAVPYGLSKAIAENLTHAAFPGRTTVVRPGLIVGPTDPTDRYTYWPVRIDEGGEVLCPGNPNHSSQIIDQRDLTEWIVRLVENRTLGDYNATGPGTRLSMVESLAACRAVTATPVTLTWVPETFLAEQKAAIWSEVPAWSPGDPLSYVSVQRAVDAGLTFRPLAVTALDTLEWDKARPAAERAKRAAGMSRARERELLAAWHARQG